LTVVDRERFGDFVMEALDSLPHWVRERLENIELIVEERPPKGEPNLLGRYQGVPLTRRGQFHSGPTFPDTITLYQRTIERVARDEEHLREVIAHTVEHEVAHFFGISDDRLREIDRY
jgi:predicted Zn-dependent protease with MMP-like domain